MKSSVVRSIVLTILSPLAIVFSTSAQSLIVGIPNAEVVPKGHILLAHESQVNWWNQVNERGERIVAWNSFNFGCYGINENLELCLTSFNIGSPGTGNVSLAGGFKTVFPLFQQEAHDWEIKLVSGLMVPFSLSGNGVGIWSYSAASFRLPVLKTRITVGPSYGTRQIFGRDVFCWMVGYEQPITDKFSIIGDWYSGTHDIGAYISALQYDVNEHLTVIAGYKFANNPESGYNTAMVEITLEF
ncbi:MAG: hypothetical protein MUF71_06520 [Candidatus Kapabacteria bacterium]|jgi:hypothetical protein|nr:hypothetical protein [Candidatus Kapabacteria bacterium]